MDTFKPLFQVISEKVQLEPADIELCKQYFEPVSFSKNSIIEAADKIPQHLYFVASGMLRLFYFDDNGNEVTSNISSPNRFITPFLSFINNRKARENIGSISDSELLKISREQLTALIQESERFKVFSLIIFEQAIIATENRANDLATLTATDRYKKLMQEQPEILQQVPVQYIASFLGIKPESLSRIRKQIIPS
jgi:CRP-like cAMP-binding protein